MTVPVARQHVPDAGEDPAGEVEREVADVAHLVVDVVPEDVEEQHVRREVQRCRRGGASR